MTSADLVPASPPADPPTPLAGLAAQLLSADTAQAVSEQIVRAVQQLPGCRDATVLWSMSWPGERSGWPQAALSTERLRLVQRAFLAADGIASALSGDSIAYRLHADPDGPAAVLLCRLESNATPPHQQAGWELLREHAARRWSSLLETLRLRDSVARLEQAERLQRALFDIADMAGSELEMSEMLRKLHQIVGGLMYAENFYIALYDKGRDAIRFIYYVDIAEPDAIDSSRWVPLSDFERALTWYLIRDGRPLMGPSHVLRRQISGPLRLVGTDSADWLGVPMLSGNDVRGVLVVQTYGDETCYSPADQALLSFVGSHILTALERKQSQEELERRVAERTQALAELNRNLGQEVEERQRGERLQRTLFRIAELAGSEASTEVFYAEIHRVVDELITARNFYIALLSEDGTTLSFPYHADEVESAPATRPVGRGFTEYLIERGQPLLASAEELLKLAEQQRIGAIGTPSESWLGVPLRQRGKVVGALVVQSYKPGLHYGARELELLTFVSRQVAHTLERRFAAEALRAAHAALEQRVEERTRELREQIAVREKIELQLKHEVMHDSLTGLPNRGYLRDRLDRVLARQRRGRRPDYAVLYADVDRFKVINDSLGHLAGDEVLKEVARRLSACVREPDVVARLGGDEFAILLEDLPGHDIPVRVAQRIIAAMGEPLTVLGKEVTTSTSVGVAMGDRRYRQADDVLRDADVAMYRAKRGGRQRFEIFDAEANQQAQDVLQLENELRRGLATRAFGPYFQPIVRLFDGAVVGREALLRWYHPSRGVLAPGDFLQVAEENGSIEAIDWQMFEISCQQAACFEAQHYITLNIAPRMLKQEDFDTRLLDLLRRCALSPSRVRLELTEGSMLQNPDHAIAMLGRLRDAGVLAAIDDFGTGYSSLSYIHRFPLQMLKIDRSFVADLGTARDAGSRAVIRAVLTLAHSLGLETIAEGIETEQQRESLIAMGCPLGQGYLLGRPSPLPSGRAG